MKLNEQNTAWQGFEQHLFLSSYLNPIIMKRNEPQFSGFVTVAKSIVAFLSSLFFNNSSKDFQRLKNFIAS